MDKAASELRKDCQQEYILSFQESTRYGLSIKMRQIEKIEDQYDVSLYDADVITLRKMLDELLSFSYATNMMTLAIVRGYIDLAISRGISKQKINFADRYVIHYNHSQITNNYFLSFEDLNDYLDLLLCADEQNSVDIFHKNYCELIYAGFTPQEVFDLPQDALNYDTGVISAYGRSYQLPEILVRRIQYDNSLPYYIVERPRGQYQRAKCDSPKLLKATKRQTQEQMIELVLKRLVLAKQKLKKNNAINQRKITINKIYVSGCMDRARNHPNSEDYLKSEYCRLKQVSEATLQVICKDYHHWLEARR